MKKIHSLIILLILASAVFVGCSPSTGDNSDGGSTGNGGGTTTTEQNTPDPTYGFTKTVNYTVVANGQSLSGTKTGAELIALAKAKNLVKDTDYTINGTTVTLTASGVEKYLGKTTEKYSISTNVNNDGYIITGGKFEAGKTVTLPIILRDGTGNTAPTEPYLVKVHIKEGETELTDIPVTVTKDHKIQFTMPEKNINVFAKFCGIRYQATRVTGYKAKVSNISDNEVVVVLCFNSEVYDNLNLKEVYGKYVLEVGNLGTRSEMFFTSLCDDYEFGVIDSNGLTILEEGLPNQFEYSPNAGLQTN